MARIRSIHPGLFTDANFVQASDKARILYLGILTEADDHGVFEWKPVEYKIRILPCDNADVAALMEELASLNMVASFEHGGRKYGVVRNFCRYQRPKKPNCRYFMPHQFRTYAGLKPLGGEPVGNQFGTGGEKSPQMEDGGGKRKEEEESKTTSSASGTARARAPDPPDEAGWLRVQIVQAYEAANVPHPPDTSHAEVLVSQGFDPKLCAAVIREGIAKNPAVRSLKYFDGAIREAHEKRPKNGYHPPPEDEKITDRRTATAMVKSWKHGSWAHEWGPQPDKPGCKIVPELLGELGITPASEAAQ